MDQLIFGIETSCDETAAAVYADPGGIRSSELFSQIDLHQVFGGVVPEIASRSHLEKIRPIIEQALQKAHCKLEDITIVAVTNKPGLPGSLLIGFCFAKAIAWVQQKKLIGVNHLEAHVFSPFLEYQIPFPHICLAASGGHTSLYLVEDFGKYQCIGHTLDDAAGEAFDKIAQLINLPYPGGPAIEKLAASVDFKDFFGYPRNPSQHSNFSFSGLKTAVLYDLIKKDAYDMAQKIFLLAKNEQLKKEVASSLLVCIGDIFVDRLHYAIRQYPNVKALTFVGGVACNKYLRKRVTEVGSFYNLPLFIPSPCYCGDNAAMIAFVGSYKAKKEEFADLSLDIM